MARKTSAFVCAGLSLWLALGSTACDRDGGQRDEDGEDVSVDGTATDTDSASDGTTVPDSDGADGTDPGDTTPSDADDTTISDADDATNPDAVDLETDKLDLLWVIDNSGSMCTRQKALRENFSQVVDALTDSGVDLHTAVTTTHSIYAAESPPGGIPYHDQHLFGPDADPSNEDTRLEPIAEAGQIQSTPHPPISFNDICHFGRDSTGQLDRNDVSPVRSQLEQAIQCTKNPTNYDSFDDNAQYETLAKCALVDDDTQNDSHQHCENVGKNDSYGVDDLVAEIFPCGQKLGQKCTAENEFSQVYRNIPKVLRFSDYAGADGTLSPSERDKMQEDFACMSFVGTRGSPYEQGLRNAAFALHPLMTGGPAGDPFQGTSFTHPVTDASVTVNNGSTRPNHGFLRADATTGVVFATDENDCSHTGHTIQKEALENSCGELNCYFPTKEGSAHEGDLIAASEIYQSIVDNVKASRRLDAVTGDDLFIASLHGNPAPYGSSEHPNGDQHTIPETCGQSGAPTQQQLRELLPVCTPSAGPVASGDRYAAFLSEAKQDGFATVPRQPSAPSSGAMCESPSSIVSPLVDLFQNL